MIEVACAVVFIEGKVLIAKRGPGRDEGCWEFPGGKVEKGEGKAQALIREIKEELAVQIKVGQHIGQSNVLVGTTQIVMDLFACSLLEGDPQNLEHEALKWIKAAVAGEPQLFEWRAKRKDGIIIWVEVNMKLAIIHFNWNTNFNFFFRTSKNVG